VSEDNYSKGVFPEFLEKIDFPASRELKAVIVVDDENASCSVKLPIRKERGLDVIAEKALFDLLGAT